MVRLHSRPANWFRAAQEPLIQFALLSASIHLPDHFKALEYSSKNTQGVARLSISLVCFHQKEQNHGTISDAKRICSAGEATRLTSSRMEGFLVHPGSHVLAYPGTCLGTGSPGSSSASGSGSVRDDDLHLCARSSRPAPKAAPHRLATRATAISILDLRTGILGAKCRCSHGTTR